MQPLRQDASLQPSPAGSRHQARRHRLPDPNPAVSGRGATLLREHGVEVVADVLQPAAEALIEMFAKYITTGLPYVTLKTASTLDGRIATHTGDSRWISNEQAREQVHAMRHRHQAIMAGIGTVLADNPSLTTRLAVPGLHPTRLIVDSQLRLPLEAKAVADRTAPTIVFTTSRADAGKREALRPAACRLSPLAMGRRSICAT